jgi:hypothetical protein
VIAHVGAIPLEELLPWVGCTGAGLLAARVWLSRQLARRDD